jgi:hypothetical protein
MVKDDIDLKVDFSVIPDNWFLHELYHLHTRAGLVGEKHKPLIWEAGIQHVEGGRLKTGKGETPNEALLAAISEIDG